MKRTRALSRRVWNGCLIALGVSVVLAVLMIALVFIVLRYATQDRLSDIMERRAAYEITSIQLAAAGKTVTIDDKEALSIFSQNMKRAVPHQLTGSGARSFQMKVNFADGISEEHSVSLSPSSTELCIYSNDQLFEKRAEWYVVDVTEIPRLLEALRELQ